MDLYLQTQGNLFVIEYFTLIDTHRHILLHFLPPIVCSYGVMGGCSCDMVKKFVEREERFITFEVLNGIE